MLDNFKVIYCSTLEGAMNYVREHGRPEYTVEAVYGNTVVEGREATYDHHAAEYRDNPAPCNADIEARDGGVILISHIDVDCMGGNNGSRRRKAGKSFALGDGRENRFNWGIKSGR